MLDPALEFERPTAPTEMRRGFTANDSTSVGSMFVARIAGPPGQPVDILPAATLPRDVGDDRCEAAPKRVASPWDLPRFSRTSLR